MVLDVVFYKIIIVLLENYRVCALVELLLCTKCLEGTTERSDDNRARSARREAIVQVLPGRQYAKGQEINVHSLA